MHKLIKSCLLFLCVVFFGYADETLPSPDRVIEIAMRDGVCLPANVYLPHNSKEKVFPCVLVRQPIGKNCVDPEWITLTNSGYALIVQATRSCCDTTGKSIPYLTDGWSDDRRPADGYDTVQWLSSAEFCNGSVSTIGVSATGITQFLLAPSSPPNLRCQFIEMAPPSMYQYAIFPGGQFKKEQVEGWLQVHHRHPSVMEWIKGKSRYDDFWSRFNFLEYADQVRVPQAHVGGWFDIFLQGTIDAFFAAQQHSQPEVRNKHRLVIGPWGHRWRYSGKVGDFVLTNQQSAPPVHITHQAWLDFHTKGIKNYIQDAPVVQYYVMGPFDGSASKGNCWKTADSWPPQGAQYVRFYLSSENNSLYETKGILRDSKEVQIPFDVKDPVPTIGGRNLFIPDGPKDLSSLNQRKDVLVYKTDQLEEDVEVTGRLWANLYISGIEKERDVCLRLVDIWPTGEQFLIAEGITHVMARRTYESKSADPRLVITDLWSTSMVFAKGHRIGVLVSASNYPSYDTSFSSDEDTGMAFTLHSTSKYPSSLALPIMRQEEEKK